MQRKKRSRRNKINKRILRCELAYITPDDCQPDLETQERLFPGIRAVCIHLFVAMDVDEGIPLEISQNDKADAIKSVSAYRVLLTELTFRQIGRLPEALKQTVWNYIDNDAESERLEGPALDLLYGCVRRAENEMDLSVFKNMTQVKIIWHAIKGAYGRQFEISDETIFDNFEDASEAP